MMLCRVKTEALRAALARAAAVVPSRTTMPVLQCALLRLDKALHVAATDLDTWVESNIPATDITPYRVAVDCRRLLAICEALTTTQDVELLLDPNQGLVLVVQQGRHRTRLFTMQADDFPRPPPSPTEAKGDALVVGGPELAEAAHLALPFVSTDESRGVIMGARFRWNGTTLTVTATNGQNLVQVMVPQPALYSAPPAWPLDAIVPRLALGAMTGVGVERIRIIRDEHRIQFDTDGVCHVSRLVAGAFPDVDGMVLQKIDECRTVIRCRAEDLVHALQRQCVTDDVRHVQARITVDNKRVSLSSVGRHAQTALEEDLDFAVKGPNADAVIPMDKTLGWLRRLEPGQDVFLRIHNDEHTPVHLLTESKQGMVLHSVVARIRSDLARKQAA